jgi:hypothetical protein
MNIDTVETLLHSSCTQKWGVSIDEMAECSVTCEIDILSIKTYQVDDNSYTCKKSEEHSTFNIMGAYWDCDNRNYIRAGEITIMLQSIRFPVELYQNDSLVSSVMEISPIYVYFTFSPDHQIVMCEPRAELTIPSLLRCNMPDICFNTTPKLTFHRRKQ